MFNKPLQQVVGVAPGAIATLRIPAEEFTLVGIKAALSGTTFDKTKITRVRVKVGPRVIWDLTYDQLNKYNNYRNGVDNTKYLYINFSERDQALFPIKQVGGLDLMQLLSVGEVFVEFYIDATAVAPVINCTGYFEQIQDNAWVTKMLPFSFTQAAAGKFTLPVQFRGALLKRLHLHYNGTNWGAAANGNLSRLECKKNGIVFFDQTCLDNRQDQVEYKKVPQANCFVADFIVDNNPESAIKTIRQAAGSNTLIYDSFEFNAYLTDAGGATVNVIAEVLDTATNL